MLSFVERSKEVADNFFFETEHFLWSCGGDVLGILDFLEVFLELSDGGGSDGRT